MKPILIGLFVLAAGAYAQQPAEIAAELMGLPVAEVRAKIPSPSRHGRTAPVHGGRTVIVERRAPVRQFRIPVR